MEHIFVFLVVLVLSSVRTLYFLDSGHPLRILSLIPLSMEDAGRLHTCNNVSVCLCITGVVGQDEQYAFPMENPPVSHGGHAGWAPLL